MKKHATIRHRKQEILQHCNREKVPKKQAAEEKQETGFGRIF